MPAVQASPAFFQKRQVPQLLQVLKENRRPHGLQPRASHSQLLTASARLLLSLLALWSVSCVYFGTSPSAVRLCSLQAQRAAFQGLRGAALLGGPRSSPLFLPMARLGKNLQSQNGLWKHGHYQAQIKGNFM